MAYKGDYVDRLDRDKQMDEQQRQRGKQVDSKEINIHTIRDVLSSISSDLLYVFNKALFLKNKNNWF